MIKSIPLDRPRVSERNVRRAANEQADTQLKADIDARGRRLRALQAAEDERLDEVA